MKIAFIADVHLGNHKRQGGPVTASLNERCQKILRVFERSLEHAEEEGCDAVMILGDLFDRHNPLPQLVGATLRRILKAGLPTVMLVGNHDQVSTAPGDHALTPFSAAGYEQITVVDAPRIVTVKSTHETCNVLCAPYQPGAVKKWLPKLMQDYAGKADVLALHLGIYDGDTPAYLRGAEGAIQANALADLCLEHGFQTVLAGDWHDRRLWEFSGGKFATGRKKVVLMQVGALVPTGWNNPGLDGYGTVAFWDTTKRLVSFSALPGPRFVRAPVTKATPNDVYLDELMDMAASKVAASEAAKAARSSTTFLEALAAFVGKMDLPSTVDRKALLSKVKDYVGG